jgi:hypothetical protein
VPEGVDGVLARAVTCPAELVMGVVGVLSAVLDVEGCRLRPEGEAVDWLGVLTWARERTRRRTVQKKKQKQTKKETKQTKHPTATSRTSFLPRGVVELPATELERGAKPSRNFSF